MLKDSIRPGGSASAVSQAQLRSVESEFSKIPTIRARTRTSRHMIRSLLAVSERSPGVNRTAATP
jgi:hypothetical protein